MTEKLFKKQVSPKAPIQGEWYHRLIYGIVNEVNKGYAPVLIICGKTGLGKSMAGLHLAELLHNKINLMKGELTPERVKENLVYDVRPFLEKVTSSEREVLIFDEAGVNINSKNWQSQLNRSVDNALQTMRIKNMVYIFIAPKVRDLDKAIRTSVDFRIIADDKRSSKNTRKFKVAKMSPKYGKINDGGKNVNKFILPPLWQPELPSKELVKAYQEKEVKWKQEDLEEKLEELKEKERQEEKEKKSADISELF